MLINDLSSVREREDSYNNMDTIIRVKFRSLCTIVVELLKLLLLLVNASTTELKMNKKIWIRLSRCRLWLSNRLGSVGVDGVFFTVGCVGGRFIFSCP